MRRPRSLPRFRPETAALALFGALLMVSVPLTLGESAQRILEAARHAGESEREARARVFGPEWAAGIERIRALVPEGGAYVLVNAVPDDPGGPYWARFDLAPRRAVEVGPLAGMTPDDVRRRALRDARWVVITRGPGRAPEALERFRFLQRLEARGAR
jgi:hypothetical protein